jgi:hypothetical protein
MVMKPVPKATSSLKVISRLLAMATLGAPLDGFNVDKVGSVRSGASVVKAQTELPEKPAKLLPARSSMAVASIST